MKHTLLLVAILLTSFNSKASECTSILTIETDDSRIYTEEGQVLLCISGNKISSVKINKPVKPYKSSSQYDERFPVLNIYLDGVKDQYTTSVLKPKRFGIEVDALFLHVKKSQFNADSGGHFKLSYLTNYLSGNYKAVHFKVAKTHNEWKLYVYKNTHYKRIKRLFVETNFTGVKKFRFN